MGRPSSSAGRSGQSVPIKSSSRVTTSFSLMSAAADDTRRGHAEHDDLKQEMMAKGMSFFFR